MGCIVKSEKDVMRAVGHRPCDCGELVLGSCFIFHTGLNPNLVGYVMEVLQFFSPHLLLCTDRQVCMVCHSWPQQY